ncbi:MAG: protoheme IX farnesyltransferase [Bacteroidetes bacterium]|nr:protoheme IX farnesyltransferase [Bacteroidota bacterium]
MIKRAGKYNQAVIAEEAGVITLKSSVSMLLELVKIRITMLVSFTTALGYFLAADNPGFGFIYPSLGIFLLACSSAALNQFQERDTDSMMERTAKRPVPSGRVTPGYALIVIVTLLMLGSAVLILKANVPALVTGLVTFFWYNAVYTPLKKKTALAIIPGSLVGALPPVAGWLAAGGSMADFRIVMVASYFFVWQIPHFWLLLLLYGDDYRKAGFPVLTERHSVRFIKTITFALLVATVLIAAAMPFAGIGYFAVSKIMLIAFSVMMIYGSLRFFTNGELTRKDTVKTFMAINLYTLLLITILSADKLFSSI